MADKASHRVQKAPARRGRQTNVDRFASALTPENIAKAQEICERIEEDLKNRPPYDEKVHLIEDLESGAYTLTLQHNRSTSAKCRATNCKIEALPQQYDEKIRGAFRFDLAVKNATNEHWSTKLTPDHRYYHVICFQDIGVDIAKYLKPPPYRHVTVQSAYCYSVESPGIHRAVDDWVMLKGKTFDVESYGGKYKEALDAHHERWSDWLCGHMDHLRRNQPCSCDPEPTVPRSEDFIEAEPFERKITEVLLDVMGAGYLIQWPVKEAGVKVLDVWGYVPDFLSEAALLKIVDEVEAKQAATTSEEVASSGEPSISLRDVRQG